MNSKSLKRSAKITGAFFILATAASVAAALLISPMLAAPDYLAAMAQNANTVVLAVVCMLVAVVAIIGIPVMLYPIIRMHSEVLALWFLSTRLLEAVFYTLGIVCTLTLLALAREGGSADTAVLVRLMSDVAFNMGTLIIFSLSAIILGIVLYRAKLVPRWLSIWAFIGGVLLFAQGILVLFGASTPTLEATLFIPIALNEMVLAVWLLTKGFNMPDEVAA
ncbi:MAG TPA: DUF4386 domain-containing protein [Rhodobacteraceae bacterium]|nr:DUF4386 domain-containing protein [Paracoccaceae bacterium]